MWDFVVGAELEGLLQVGGGFLEAAAIVEELAEVEAGVELVRGGRERLLPVGDGLV